MAKIDFYGETGFIYCRIDTLVYRTGLANQNYSYATAIGLFSGLIGIVLVAGSNSLSKRLTGDGIY